MFSSDSTQYAGYGQPSPTTQTTPTTTGIDWGGIINTGIGALSDVYNNYVNAQMQAAGMANAASAAAQMQQFEMTRELIKQQAQENRDVMNAQMAYNAQSAQKANELQYLMQQEAMAFNAEQAEKQRSWQTEMSATAYQRAVEDMRKAGINPILAATNGGANVGSGASASISSAKAAQAQGVSSGEVGLGGVGNYTGQGYHLSDSFATFGAILGTVGNVLSALQSSNIGQGIQNYITDGIAQVTNGIGNGIKKTSDKIYETMYSPYKNYRNSWFYNNAWSRMVRRQWNDMQTWWDAKSRPQNGGGGGHYF